MTIHRHAHTHSQKVNLRVIAIQMNPILSMDVDPFSTKLKENKPNISIHSNIAVIQHVL